jgi:hypothetical protein
MIYFIIAFAGVSLCRLLPSILLFGTMKADEFKSTLNTTISDTVEWLRSVAISEDHIAFKFAEIIHGLHSQTLRRERRRETNSLTTTPTDAVPAMWSPLPQSSGGFAQPFALKSLAKSARQAQYPFESPNQSYAMEPSPGALPGVPGQPGFVRPTVFDESYFSGLFPELMGPGFVEGGYAAGLGQGVGGNGFDDAFGFWGFNDR